MGPVSLLKMSFFWMTIVLLFLNWNQTRAQLGIVDLGEDKNHETHIMIRDSTAVLNAAEKTLKVLGQIKKITVRP